MLDNIPQKEYFVESSDGTTQTQSRLRGTDQTMTNRQNVESTESAVTDQGRGKDFLDPAEIDRLLEAAKKSRNGVRDHLLLLMMYRHGLRVSEAVELKVSDVNLDQSRLWVSRKKNGLSVEQPIPGDELRAIKRHLRQRDNSLPWLFLSERKQPLTRFSINKMITATAKRAGLDGVHPHTLRHSCGYYLANQGTPLRVIQDYLGHRDPRHTVHYTRVAGVRFEGLW